MEDFKAFPPPPAVIDIAGGSIALSPIRLGELPRFLGVVRPIAEELIGEPDWVALLGRHGEAVLELLAITARRDRAWVDALSLNEAVALAAALFEVNADFFVAQVVPAIQDAAQRIAPTLRATRTTGGTTPSPA